jgi:long-chain acyl-CoA synthetase
VRRLAAGLHGLGVRRSDTVGFMLSNRPEFHLLDTAAMHLGATPFSIYNSSSAEQIAYLLGDAGNRVLIVEAAFLPQARAALERHPVDHLIVLDGATESSISLEALEEGLERDDFDFDAAWRAVQPGMC